MKSNSYDRIASKAHDLAYAMTKAIEKHDDADWMIFHGMTVALEQFGNLLYAKKACEQWHDMLLTVIGIQLDIRCSMDCESTFFCVEEARALSELTEHVFYRISRKESVDDSYVQLLRESAAKHAAMKRAA